MKMDNYQHFASFNMVWLEKCFSTIGSEWLVEYVFLTSKFIIIIFILKL